MGAGVGYDDAAMQDAQLVKAICDGDKDAFAELYDRYSDNVYAFLCTVTRNREEAADALQDTFLAAATRMHQLRDPAKLRSWLFAIARHNAMHSFARTSKQQPLEDVDVIDSGPQPSEVAESQELAELLRQAAGGLGEQERVVLGLHLEQGLQGQELGDALGVSASHAYVLMNRMRQQVERSVGALLVARQGRQDCAKLQDLLKSWDGRFSVLWRKRVARHVDSCQVCEELRKRLVSPIAMMAVPPLIPAPAEAREAILEQLELVGFRSKLSEEAGAGEGESSPADADRVPEGADQVQFSSAAAAEPWPKRYGGFPPPMVRSRRRPVALAIAAAFLLLLFAGPVAGGFEGAVSPAGADVPLEFPYLAGSPSAQEPQVHQSAPLPTPSQPNVRPPGGTSADVPDPSPSPSVQPSPDPSTSPRAPQSPGAERTPQENPSSSPVDDTAPSLRVSVQPPRVYATSCAGRTDPTQAEVSAFASDQSGIDEVTLSYQGASTKMTSSGGGYSATVGPFRSPGKILLTVRATDGGGLSTTRSASLEVYCPQDPAPVGQLRAPQDQTTPEPTRAPTTLQYTPPERGR